MSVRALSEWKNSYFYLSTLYRREKLTRIAKGEREDEFRRFHDFVFKYHILVPGRKSLGKEEVLAILPVEFSKRHQDIGQKFLTFFKESKYIDINRDQWSVMLVVFALLSKGETYDVDGACTIRSNMNRSDDL